MLVDFCTLGLGICSLAFLIDDERFLVTVAWISFGRVELLVVVIDTLSSSLNLKLNSRSLNQIPNALRLWIRCGDGDDG